MNPLNWMKNKVINLLAMLRREDDRPSAMTILPDYETAFLISIGRAYSRPDVRPSEFIESFYNEFERYLTAVGGKAREDVKEVYTRREFFDQYIKNLYQREKKEDEGVRLA